MSGANKILKKNGRTPNELEMSVANALFEIQMTSREPLLRELYITGAKEFHESSATAAVICVFYPFPLRQVLQKVQFKLVRDLEKKFPGKHVFFVAMRRILKKPSRKLHLKQKRPISRTLTGVHCAVLDDIVYPAEVVGKRIRVRLGGSRLIKVHLDSSTKNDVDNKTDSMRHLYKCLTGKECVFEFHQAL